MPATDSILAIDPGLRHPAAAFFRRGVLVAASRGYRPAYVAATDRQASRRAAAA